MTVLMSNTDARKHKEVVGNPISRAIIGKSKSILLSREGHWLSLVSKNLGLTGQAGAKLVRKKKGNNR